MMMFRSSCASSGPERLWLYLTEKAHSDDVGSPSMHRVVGNATPSGSEGRRVAMRVPCSRQRLIATCAVAFVLMGVSPGATAQARSEPSPGTEIRSDASAPE